MAIGWSACNYSRTFADNIRILFGAKNLAHVNSLVHAEQLRSLNKFTLKWNDFMKIGKI